MQHKGLHCCDGSGGVRPFLMSVPPFEALLTRCFIGGAGSGTDIGIPPTTGQERHSTRTPTPIPPPAPTLFDSHHHRIRADQVFHTGFPEPDVVQPSTAVSPRIVETALRREQHVQTHQ